jgi:MSHA pilin protein MshA
MVVVIVILGILAAVAIPKYQDLTTAAKQAAADGVYGAAQGATAINFATSLVSPTYTDAIVDGQSLLDAMDGTPDGWSALNDSIVTTGFSIGVTVDETATNKAVLAKSW